MSYDDIKRRSDIRLFELLAHIANSPPNKQIDFEKILTIKDHHSALEKMRAVNVPTNFQDNYKKYFGISELGKTQHEINLELTKRLRLAEELVSEKELELVFLRKKISQIQLVLAPTSSAQFDSKTMDLAQGC